MLCLHLVVFEKPFQDLVLILTREFSELTVDTIITGSTHCVCWLACNIVHWLTACAAGGQGTGCDGLQVLHPLHHQALGLDHAGSVVRVLAERRRASAAGGHGRAGGGVQSPAGTPHRLQPHLPQLRAHRHHGPGQGMNTAHTTQCLRQSYTLSISTQRKKVRTVTNLTNCADCLLNIFNCWHTTLHVLDTYYVATGK